MSEEQEQGIPEGKKLVTVVSNHVTKPGSPPDVDTDYNTGIIEESIQHERDLYGSDSVAKISVFQTYKARGSFSKMASIYSMNFAKSNRISSMIPNGASLKDTFDETSESYPLLADFRAETTSDDWRKIIDSAAALEGRISADSIHPCGVIVSSKDLTNVIPLRYTGSGEAVTQWTYPECESIGLIKMDFLKLDTVDLIQDTVRNILAAGKEAPNMVEIEKGPMDDEKTFKMFQKGRTTGVFQMGGQGVQSLLRSMKPTTIHDIAATTALYRPGPMGMNSHTIYADRSSGRETVPYPVHEDFKDSPMEGILSNTYGLIVYQEQIMQISKDICGMTLQEGDKLRKAVGKKKLDVMLSMKDRFISGGMSNGYSEEAMKTLWNTIEVFSAYAFNSSHSYSYAMLAYETGYLKANYPVEFMAACIAQRIGDKGRLRETLKEASRMGLKVGTVDINRSGINVTPNSNRDSDDESDIYLGFTSVKGLSYETARRIVSERDSNGEFTSLPDFISRCVGAGVNKANVFEGIALAGGFDELNITRKSAISNVKGLIRQSHVKNQKGTNLFESAGSDEELKIEFSDEEFPFAERLKLEADSIGMYLSNHPTDYVGKNNGLITDTTIENLVSTNRYRRSIRVAGGVNDYYAKTTRNGSKVRFLTIDDGTGYLECRLSPNLNRSITKYEIQEGLKTKYMNGETEITPEWRKVIESSADPVRTPETNSLYTFEIKFIPAKNEGENPGATIESMRPIFLDENGRLPVRVRLNKSVEIPQKALDEGQTEEDYREKKERNFLKIGKVLDKKFPGPFQIYTARYSTDGSSYVGSRESNQVFKDALRAIDDELNQVSDEQDSESPESPQSGVNRGQEQRVQQGLFGNLTMTTPARKPAAKKSSKSTKPGAKKQKRSWPPERRASDSEYVVEVPLNEFVEELEYTNTGYTCDANTEVSELLNKYFVSSDYDFGVLNESDAEDYIDY